MWQLVSCCLEQPTRLHLQGAWSIDMIELLSRALHAFVREVRSS